jgi:hypothetical protein
VAFLPRSSRRALAIVGLAIAVCFVYRPMLEGRVLAGRDVFRLFIPDTALLLECLGRGEWPLWNPYQRLGQPFLATLHSQALYPPRLVLALLAGPVWTSSWEQVFHVLIAATGTFLACRRLGATSLSASVGATTFSLTPLFTQLAVQQNVVSSAAWSGFLVWAAVRVARHPTPRPALALGVFTALSFLSGSPETLLWQGLLVSALLVARQRPGRRLAVATAGATWGLVLCGAVLVPGVELALLSDRAAGTVEQATWSMPLSGLVSLGWLNFDLPRPEYAGGEQNFVPITFVGTVTCALALLGPPVRTMRRLSFHAAALGSALRPPGAPVALVGGALALLSLGAHFLPAAWLLSWPPFSLFRYPAKYVVGAAFCLSVSAALGLDALAASARTAPGRRSFALGAVGLAAPLAALAVPLADSLDLRAGAGPGFAWAAVFLGLLGFVTWWPRGEERRMIVHRGVALVIIVELFAVQSLSGMEAWLPASDLTSGPGLGQAIDRPQRGRLSVQLSPQLALDEGLAYVPRSLGSLVPLRFVELGLKAVEGYGAPELGLLDSVLAQAPRTTFDLLAVTDYVRDGPGPPFPDLEAVATPSGLPSLWRSDTALPRTFVVHQAEPANDREAFDALGQPDARWRHRILLAGDEPPLRSTASCASRAAITAESSNAVLLEVDACADGYVVLSDRFFPGWEAEVDGAPAPIARADLLLRAVRVAPGRHRVAFRYRPASFRFGLVLSATAALVGLLFLRRRPA